MKDENDNQTIDWVEVLALRSAYNQGVKTDQTRAACNLYMAERNRKKKANKLEAQG